eukprot:g4813.t1
MDDYYFSDETVLHPFPRTFLMSQKSEGSLQASPLYPPAEKENINKRNKLFDTNRLERRRSKAAKRIQRRWRSRNLHKELSREAAAITQKTQRLEELRKRKAAVQLLCAFVRVYGAEILEDF